MTEIPQDKLAALASTGAPNRQIEAALGRKMTEAERATVDRQRLTDKLRRRVKKDAGPKSKSSMMDAKRKRERLIEYECSTPPEDARRRRLEKDPAKWLAYYCEDRFPLPFGTVHKEIITACIRAMTQGTSITVAAPRGFGKTAVVWGMALYGVLTGLCRFPVVIGWKASAGAELLDQWLQALSNNERLAAAYPCQCRPFQDSTASNRLKGILRKIDPETKAGCDVRKTRGTVLLPDVREADDPQCLIKNPRTMPQVALAGASMNGSIKGLNIGLLSGESLRPDIVLMDDPQDEQTADSETLVKKVIKKIDYGIRSLSGPRRRLTVMATVTCVNIGDVSEHLLTRPGTEVIKTGQITNWPTGWDADKSASRAAWDQWNDERLRGLENLDGGKRARAYYKANKAELSAGMAVSWRERYHAGDGLRVGDPDALYAAMWDYYDLGEMAFMAERQNQPVKEGVTVYNLTPKVITARTDPDRTAGEIPDWALRILALTDVNPSYALTTVILAFGQNQRSAVLWYGAHPIHCDKELTDAEKKTAVMNALATHGVNLAALPCRPHHWMIDGGGSPENTVIDFAANSVRNCGIPAITAFGRAGKAYRHPLRKEAGVYVHEQAYTKRVSANRQWVLFNADYWREQAQRAWTGTLGAPGSCDLPKGNHREFAEQICAEQLAGKVELNGRWVYDWKTQSNQPHDYGDCMAMGYAFAAVNGIGTGGGAVNEKPQRKRYTQAQLTGGR
jgi:hypothetical protein